MQSSGKALSVKQVSKGGLAKIDQLINRNGFIRYWDNEGRSPYLFNPQSKIRIAYEDSISVRLKCEYIQHKKMAGIMYWDYFSDPDRNLLNTVYSVLRKPTGRKKPVMATGIIIACSRRILLAILLDVE